MKNSLCFVSTIFVGSLFTAAAGCASAEPEAVEVSSAAVGTRSTFPAAGSVQTRSWSPWFPFRRGQDFGERFVNTWQTSAHQNSVIGGQSTYRFPKSGDVIDGAPANRPNATMPAYTSRAGYTSFHVVDYYMNWWCAPSDVYTPSNRAPNHDCAMPGYFEIQSETPDSRYLELWGWGDAALFRTSFRESVCLNGSWSSPSVLAADKRDAYLWGLPASFGVANAWVAPTTCEVHYKGFTTPLGRQRAYVAVIANKELQDGEIAPGKPRGYDVLEAINAYYYEVDPATPSRTLGGEACMTDARVAALPYGRDAFGQAIPARRDPDAAHPYGACLWALEHYFMRRIDADARDKNGFGSWEMAANGWTSAPNWTRSWNATSQNPFTREKCDFANGIPTNCR